MILDGRQPEELHPPYYKAQNGTEPWDIIKAFDLDYWRGTAVAYLCRAGLKGDDPEADELNDLRKALTFIAERVRMLEEQLYPQQFVEVPDAPDDPYGAY